MTKKTFTLLSALTFFWANSFGQAELQVIHNCADPAASVVDVYVNGNLALDDFGFRQATPFLNLPSNTNINIGIAPGTSNSVNDTLVNFQVSLNANERYVALASGVLNPAAFASNPDNISTSFGLQVLSGIQTSSQNPANVDLIINHGSTDAPTVDVVARKAGIILDDAAYSNFSNYISVPAADYVLDITPGNDNNTIVASFEAELTALAGGTAVVFASGFLDPTQNQNGSSFGLYAALTSGTVVMLPTTSVAHLQVIHNAADPAAASVDVYLNGTLALDDFAFRTATPFIDIPGDVTINIGVAPGNSTSVNDTLVNFAVQFTNGETYVAVANGVLNPGSFASNPDGISTGFTLFLESGIRESALVAGEVDFKVVHGATDAPTVDVVLSNGGPILVDDAAYSDITPYLNVPAASYSLDVTPGNDNSIIVASYTADLSSLAGGSAIVFASGFLTPANNQNGEPFGLFAALANGTVVPFQLSTSLNEVNQGTGVTVYPNPVNANGSLTISGEIDNEVGLDIINTEGKIVRSVILNAGITNFTIDLSNIASGIYLIRTIDNKSQSVQKLVVR